MSKISNTACPSCVSNGHDTHGDNLVKFANGSAHCYSCGYHEGNAIPAPSNVNADSLYLPPSSQIAGIAYDTAAFHATTSDGTYTYFHSFDENNTLVSVKSRCYAAELLGADKHQTIKYSGELILYGLHTLVYTDTLVICEGESDKHFIWQCLGGGIDTLAMPGASTAKLLLPYIDLVSNYDKIIIVTDNDAAGLQLRKAMYGVLPDWLTYEGTYPAHANDARDCTRGEIIALVNDAKPVSMDTHVIRGYDAHVSAVSQNSSKTRFLCSFAGLPGVNRLLGGGIHAGDFIGILGNSGKGKSTLTYQLAANAINQCIDTVIVTNEADRDFVCASLLKYTTLEMLGDYCTIVETYTYKALITLLTKYGNELVFIDVINSIAPDFLEPVATGAYMRGILHVVNQEMCAVITTCHTTSNNEYMKPMPLKLSDAAGGRAVQRALNGVIAFTADLEHLPPNARLLTLAKPLRHRHVADAAPAILHFNAGLYTEYQG